MYPVVMSSRACLLCPHLSFCPSFFCYPFHAPVSLLRPSEHFFSFLGQLGLATVSGDLLKEDGLELGARPLPFPGLLALCFFEVLLDGRGLGELLRVDGIRDAAPEFERFVRELLVHGRKGFRGDAEGGNVDDGGACFRRVGVLWNVIDLVSALVSQHMSNVT